MLVLHRKVGQRIFLDLPNGERIIVQVTAIESGRVKLGFEAPADVLVNREEVVGRKEGTS